MYGTSPGYGNAFGHTGFQQSYVGPVPAGDHALGAAIESSSEEILAAVNPNLRPDAQQENPSDESEFSGSWTRYPLERFIFDKTDP